MIESSKIALLEFAAYTHLLKAKTETYIKNTKIKTTLIIAVKIYKHSYDEAKSANSG